MPPSSTVENYLKAIYQAQAASVKADAPVSVSSEHRAELDRRVESHARNPDESLTWGLVLDQLREHTGRQFDYRVVRALLRSDILAAFADMMRTSRDEAIPERAFDAASTVAIPVAMVHSAPPRVRQTQPHH